MTFFGLGVKAYDKNTKLFVQRLHLASDKYSKTTVDHFESDGVMIGVVKTDDNKVNSI